MTLDPLSQELLGHSRAVVASQLMAQPLSRSVSVGVHQLRSPLANRRCHQAKEEPHVVESGEVELLPPTLLHLPCPPLRI
jgi:hypothetical protein